MPLTQFEQIQSLLSQLTPGNRFYAAKLAGLGAVASLEEFSARAPFTRKSELIEDQQAHPPYGTNLTFPLARYTRFTQTSATTGKPMRWLDTPESWNWMLDCWQRVFEAASVTAADRVFCAFSFGPFLGFWTAFEAASRMGCLAIPGGGMRSPARLAAMIDTGATVLCATPTYAIHLAEVAAEEGIDLRASCIRRIFVAGEPGGSILATRRRIESLWPGAQVVDQHGMTEIGPVSYGCPARPGILHVMEDKFLAEVIDPASGAVVAPGNKGELVLTNFGRAGSPLIRYRTGDLVEAEPPGACACGTRDLSLAGGILGRADDMLVVRGVNVYPVAVEEIVRSCCAGEYRVWISEERALVELSLEVEAPNGDRSLAHRIETALRDALALRIPVSVVDPGTLPRFELKARRWVRR
ncbi:MAG: AMP-binding protein [Bryobacteraceae bacterium]